ncbi:MAG: hypothetical protein LR017_03850 [Candidatus Pacebacteria bacterium]|nr:hypothetical protein [Candidatus Paceibacterota bacterium]
MNHIKYRIVSLCIALVGLSTATLSSFVHASSLPVFPGAEGYGTDTTAGRGGIVCKVTNLNNAGAGSFRACVEQSGPRTIVFDVGGTITLTTPVVVQHPYISIFGQTAPGDGIMIRGADNIKTAPFKIATHDVLIQHMRFRAGGASEPNCCRDGLAINNATPGQVYNVVLDHNSISWGTDGVLDTYYDVHDITLSRNIIGPSLHNATNDEGPAGLGVLLGSQGAHSFSLHHNYFVHLQERAPFISVGINGSTPAYVDFTNNLIYNWVHSGTSHATRYGDVYVNLVKNRYIAGPRSVGPEVSILGHAHLHTNDLGIYLEGNISPMRPSHSDPEDALLYVYSNPNPATFPQSAVASARYPTPAITEMPVDDLETQLITDVGATKPRRDSVDTQLVADLQNRTGDVLYCVTPNDPGVAASWCAQGNNGGWPTYQNGTPEPDADADGMPDAWETVRGLDMHVYDAAGDPDGNGYTNIEEYVFELAGLMQSAPAQPVTVSGLPITIAPTIQEESVTVTLAKPADATTAEIILEAYDADAAGEGTLTFNGKTQQQLTLFGTQGTTANNNTTSVVRYTVPAAWLTTGTNTFTFRQLSSWYRITGIDVQFDGSAAPASYDIAVSPTSVATGGAMQVTWSSSNTVDGAVVVVPRGATHTSSVSTVLVDATGGTHSLTAPATAGEYEVVLYRTHDSSGAPLASSVELARSSVVTATTPAPPATPVTELPITIGPGNTSEVAVISVNKPAGVSNARITLEAYDADASEEGGLTINGTSAHHIPLFGSAGTNAYNNAMATHEYVVPATWFADGENVFTFTHLASWYHIRAIDVTFE